MICYGHKAFKTNGLGKVSCNQIWNSVIVSLRDPLHNAKTSAVKEATPALKKTIKTYAKIYIWINKELLVGLKTNLQALQLKMWSLSYRIYKINQ